MGIRVAFAGAFDQLDGSPNLRGARGTPCCVRADKPEMV